MVLPEEWVAAVLPCESAQPQHVRFGRLARCTVCSDLGSVRITTLELYPRLFSVYRLLMRSRTLLALVSLALSSEMQFRTHSVRTRTRVPAYSASVLTRSSPR